MYHSITLDVRERSYDSIELDLWPVDVLEGKMSACVQKNKQNYVLIIEVKSLLSSRQRATSAQSLSLTKAGECVCGQIYPIFCF